MIDIRCKETNHVTRACCQLQIGHVGPHAVMATDASHRVIYVWEGAGVAPRPEAADMAHLHSWAPGCPTVYDPAEFLTARLISR